RADGIDVATERRSAAQGGFDERRAAAHERVVDSVARPAEALDKKSRELRFKTRAIRNFVKRIRGALFGSPEFVDVSGHGDGRAGKSFGARFNQARWL